MTQTFSGNNYSIETNTEGQFILVHPVSKNETFDSFEELVESHPVCEEARTFFFKEVADTVEDIGCGFYEAADGTVIYSP